jgi:hypothetical protein
MEFHLTNSTTPRRGRKSLSGWLKVWSTQPFSSVPDAIILTGGMLARGEMLFGPLRRFYNEMLKIYPEKFRPPVLAAKLGDKAGVVGAIVLAKVGHAE